MTDDQPICAPEPQPVASGESRTSVELWRLRRGDHMLVCELHDKRVGVDVLTLDAVRWPLLTQRCASHAHAEFVAMSYRRTYLREGWRDSRSSSPPRS